MILFAALVAAVFFFAIIMAKISSLVQKTTVRLIGVRGYLIFFGWFGSAVHELSHASMCVLFGHKIHEIKLFRFDSIEGKCGYVSHIYNPKSVIQRLGNTFIGIAPLFGGPLVLFLAALWLLPELLLSFDFYTSPLDELNQVLVALPIRTVRSLFSLHNLTNPKLYLFFYLLVSVVSGMRLSATDLRNAIIGFGPLLLVALLTLTAILLVDRIFGFRLLDLFLSTACLGYNFIFTVVTTALIILGSLNVITHVIRTD